MNIETRLEALRFMRSMPEEELQTYGDKTEVTQVDIDDIDNFLVAAVETLQKLSEKIEGYEKTWVYPEYYP